MTMRLIFTIEAKRDLDELRAYLQPLSASGLNNVVTAIQAKIRLGMENPSAGRLTPRDNVRELVETRYGFLIPYYVKDDRFQVLRVYRSLRAPLDYHDLNLS